MVRRTWLLLTIALGSHFVFVQAASGADASAEFVARPSREDARDLALLAPPAPRATETASYGDARLVRPRIRRTSVGDQGSDAPLGLFYCPNRKGRPTHGLCARDPRRVGFRRFYAYTPSYATSPQVRRDGTGRAPSLLPPATAFFYRETNRLLANPSRD